MIIKSIVSIFRLVKTFINLIITGFKELILAIKDAKVLYVSGRRIEKNTTVRRSSHKDINNEIF